MADLHYSEVVSESCPPVADNSASAQDTYDDDLVWILEKLISRTGGVFGAIHRYEYGEGTSGILARGGEFPARSDEVAAALAVAARASLHFDRRRRDDAANISQWPVVLPDQQAFGARILCLSFLPAPNVSIIAVICKLEAAEFAMSQLFVATTLYPVLARYVRLWWLHRIERRRANALSVALDLSDLGVFLLDRRSKLLFTNTKAAALLGARDGLCRNDHSIGAAEPGDGVRFQAAIQHAIHCNLAGRCNVENPLQGAPPARTPIVALRRREGKRSLIATLMNVDRVAVDPRDPAVIVYVLDPEQDVQRLLLPACHLYKLTAAETRLVYQLVSGSSITEAAARMKIQLHTARTYLKQVFAKTSTNRQADLVRVMLSSLLRTNAKIDLALI